MRAADAPPPPPPPADGAGVTTAFFNLPNHPERYVMDEKVTVGGGFALKDIQPGQMRGSRVPLAA